MCPQVQNFFSKDTPNINYFGSTPQWQYFNIKSLINSIYKLKTTSV